MFILKKKKISPEPAGQLQSSLVQTCMVGIQVYSNKSPNPLQRGNNHKSAKIG
jgi:hypothetical protein